MVVGFMVGSSQVPAHRTARAVCMMRQPQFLGDACIREVLVAELHAEQVNSDDHRASGYVTSSNAFVEVDQDGSDAGGMAMLVVSVRWGGKGWASTEEETIVYRDGADTARRVLDAISGRCGTTATADCSTSPRNR